MSGRSRPLTSAGHSWPLVLGGGALPDLVRGYAAEHFATDNVVLVTDETGFLKQCKASYGVWLGRSRRLTRDHGLTVSSAVAFFTLAAAMILVRQWLGRYDAGSYNQAVGRTVGVQTSVCVWLSISLPLRRARVSAPDAERPTVRLLTCRHGHRIEKRHL
jgi:hypothetical protein